MMKPQRRENEEFKVLYRAKIDSFVESQDTYLSNIGNAFALIFGQYSLVMQSKMQASANFNSRINSNPIERFNAIE
jgi:hypothetical protein